MCVLGMAGNKTKSRERGDLALYFLKQPRKIDLLIEAFAVVAKRVPAARLRLIGPADDRYWLEYSQKEELMEPQSRKNP